MEKNLNHYLRENERVCWQGKPMAFPLLEKGVKTRLLSRWIITVVAAAGLLVAYSAYNNVKSLGFIGVVIAVVLLITLSPVLEKRNITKQQYWITNQRVILQDRDKSFYYMELAEIDDYRVVSDLTDQPCLVLGSRIFEEINKQLRWRTCHPLVEVERQGDADHAAGLVLYGIGNTQAAETLLKQHAGKEAA